MPLIAITREMGSLGNEVARKLGDSLGLPVVYHEVIEHLADKMRVRKSHVMRLIDGSAGLMERLTADKTSLTIYTAEEIYGLAARTGGAVIRGWGATHLLRAVPHALCVRVCAPFELRKQRMMERLNTGDFGRVEEEIRTNDEAHTAIMRRHFGLQWTDPEHYDVVFNTQRVKVDECVEEILSLVDAPQFREDKASLRKLDDLALAARVRSALRRAKETRDAKVRVGAEDGKVTLSGAAGNDQRLALLEVVSTVPGVRDVSYRTLQ